MARKTSTKKIVLTLLEMGPCILPDLVRATNVSPTAVRSAISRLRDAGYDIHSSASPYGSGSPRYTLIAGPGVIEPFTCRGCGRLIRTSRSHDEACRFNHGANQ